MIKAEVRSRSCILIKLTRSLLSVQHNINANIFKYLYIKITIRFNINRKHYRNYTAGSYYYCAMFRLNNRTTSKRVFMIFHYIWFTFTTN